MSTAQNHKKRSHRSTYKSRCFSGSRKSVVKPAVRKSRFSQLVKMFRDA